MLAAMPGRLARLGHCRNAHNSGALATLAIAFASVWCTVASPSAFSDPNDCDWTVTSDAGNQHDQTKNEVEEELVRQLAIKLRQFDRCLDREPATASSQGRRFRGPCVRRRASGRCQQRQRRAESGSWRRARPPGYRYARAGRRPHCRRRQRRRIGRRRGERRSSSRSCDLGCGSIRCGSEASGRIRVAERTQNGSGQRSGGRCRPHSAGGSRKGNRPDTPSGAVERIRKLRKESVKSTGSQL